MKTSVILICKLHREFKITPSNHIYNKKGCPICEKEIKNKKFLIKFIEKSNKVHNNKYDYSKVNYINSKTKVKIICPIHGEFSQCPKSHISGHGCKKCIGESNENFIKDFKKIHNNKYDYSMMEFNETNITIICPIHGKFKLNKYQHKKGTGCPSCSKYTKGTTTSFIEMSNKVHNNKYDYSLVNYINNETKVKIICPVHGEFLQSPGNHILRKNGCPSCSKNKKYTTETFINKSNLVHNNKYDYSKVNYINSKSKVNIICPTHGEFSQIPSSHIKGYGCKKCADNYILNENINEYKIYKKLVRRYTERNKKQLFESWDGFDYYDNEFIEENLKLNHTDRNYPTIDHKISVYYGYLNKIDPEIISELSNLCITKKWINSSKSIKIEENFIL